MGERLVPIEPMRHFKTNKLIYDGKPETITLGAWKDKNVADLMAEHIRFGVDKKTWKIWVE